jgi:hypothetical protein
MKYPSLINIKIPKQKRRNTMKKTLLPAVILLMFLSSTTFAQLPFKLGARVGLNIANLSFSPDLPSAVDKSSRIGFKFGAAAELGFIPMFAVQIEPMYVMKGAKSNFTEAQNSDTRPRYPLCFCRS